MGFFKDIFGDMGLGEKIIITALSPILVPVATVAAAYDIVTGDNNSSRHNDDNWESEERRQRENEYREAEAREKKALDEEKIRKWNSCIDGYLTADFKNYFQVQNINDIDSLKEKINSSNFPHSYKSYSNAQKSIDELNNKIHFIDEALKTL